MLNLLVSISLGLLVGGGMAIITGLHPAVYIFSAIVVYIASSVFIARKVINQVNRSVQSAQSDLMSNKLDSAIETLKEIPQKYGKWHFGLDKQAESQIGIAYYRQRDFDSAFNHLKDCSSQSWMAMAMLGIIYMKRQKIEDMKKTFEKAVVKKPKTPLLWNIYAYCLLQIGEQEQTLDVMNRGLKQVGGDERLQSNLLRLMDGKKMNMSIYGDLWGFFHLESSKPTTRKRQKGFKRVIK